MNITFPVWDQFIRFRPQIEDCLPRPIVCMFPVETCTFSFFVHAHLNPLRQETWGSLLQIVERFYIYICKQQP